MVKAYLDLLDQLEEKNLLIQKQDEIIKRLSLKLLESENYKQEVEHDGKMRADTQTS
jgi:hypothetical protein